MFATYAYNNIASKLSTFSYSMTLQYERIIKKME